MKKYLLPILLLFSINLFSQFNNNWKKVYQFELDGKIKSAQDEVNIIYKKAKNRNKEAEIIKCFFYLSKFEFVFNEEAHISIIKNLQEEIKYAKPVSKAILRYIYITILEKYKVKFNYEIRNRTPIENHQNTNFLIWSMVDFTNEINITYSLLLENEYELRASKVKDFEIIFDVSPNIDVNNYTIFDYLFKKYCSYLATTITIDYATNNTFFSSLLNETNTFLTIDAEQIENKQLKKIVLLFQNNENYYIKNKPLKLDEAYYYRLTIFNSIFEDEKLYNSKTIVLEKTTTDLYIKQELRVERANYYKNKSNYENAKNELKKAYDLCDTIIKTNINTSALKKAINLKNEILSKRLSLQMSKISYENQNIKAFLKYKNIDSLTISYYKLPSKLNYLFREDYNYTNKNHQINDSIISEFTTKNLPLKTQKIIVQNSKDFLEHSTEILLHKLKAGKYLIYISTPDGNKNAFVYHTIEITDLMVVDDVEENRKVFYAYHRKTGKPLENVKFINQGTTYLSNINGKVEINFIKKNPRILNQNEVYIVYENDTISQKYYLEYENEIEENNYANYEAKAAVFFDRAIYRPGQKVFYKVVLVQKNEGKLQVVPYVTTHVKIYGENNALLKEMDVQTNEFGSYSGEFDIPKNILTGDFYITIEEGDKYENDTKYYNTKEDEHAFWDNVDFHSDDFYFKVEEYKRPTFEVTFEEIKENYTLNDTIKIKGKAKALAGNNLTNVIVKYSISKHTISKNNYIPVEDNFINNTIETDENGDFFIEFASNTSDINIKDIDSYEFFIHASVTDTNGETREATKSVFVGKELLKIQLNVKNKLIAEETNKISIRTTNANNYPKVAKGILKIYELKRKKFIKQRDYEIPEFQTISREEHQRLFPYEPYDKSDLETEEKLIKSILFDTETSNEYLLDFLNQYKNATIKIIAEALDENNNLIKTEKTCTITSKLYPSIENELFVFKDITENNQKNYTFEIQSSIPNLYITSRMYAGKKLQNNCQTIQLVNGKAIVKILKEDSKNQPVYFDFSCIWENNCYIKNFEINKNSKQDKLEIEIENIRNKIEPGSTENWSFKIKNKKLEAEILASMYDSSLDQFTKTEWSKLYFHSNYYPDRPNYPSNYNTVYIAINNFDIAKNYFRQLKTRTELYWFGFDFTNPKNVLTYNQHLSWIRNELAIPINSKLITGIVTNMNNPLPGASIVVAGTTRGTVADYDGNFSIEAANGETLIINYIGFESKKIKINAATNLEIELNNYSTIQEVVVVNSMGIKRDKFDEDEDYPNSKLKNALSGRVNGIEITQASNDNAIIRGISTINGNTNPLYVIDGVVSTKEDFLKLKQNEIENINVLKDNAATSLYGNLGANGVLLITTKKGIEELSQVKTRNNFNETAFFFPHIKTDEEGRFSLQFTTPESLTLWKLRLFAHNANFENGYLESSIISQKNVMIQTNMPRFVREKDKITLTAKVVNLTNDIKSGIVKLILYDASTMQVIDEIVANKKNVLPFNCKPKQSVPVSWSIEIPEGLQGLHYKIIAKSGNYSDGEENVLPVLSNKILITESIPIWLKGNTKKEFVFDNLKNNDSKTLKNHLFVLEYTSNPTWLALQSLPYLIEYQHECAEQTFSRYYGNFIATEIIASNPKIVTLFESWKNNSKAISKLTQNEELKSIILNETPWLLETENEEIKNKNLALLMDLYTMKESQERTLKKIEEKQLTSGGFSWFDGGEENIFITQHIVSGFGHLSKMFPEKITKFKNITSKAISYLDNRFISQSKKEPINDYAYSNLHYLYARSFYLEEYPISKKIDSIIDVQKVEFKTNWTNYSLYQKGLLALSMNRFGDKKFAEKIISSLKETVAQNNDFGMYWIENKDGYYWYQSAIETQALLIEAFSEIVNDKNMVEEMKVWLIKQKQLKNWPTTKATTEAVYALLLQGSDYTSIQDNTKFKIGNEKVLSKKLKEKEKETASGYIKMNWKPEEISTTMGQISIENKSDVAGFGGLYWQYFEELDAIKLDRTSALSISKKLYKKIKTSDGNKLIDINSENVKIGDLITIRLIIKTNNDLEFIHLKDLRASCFEPTTVLSNYVWQANFSYYKSTKDVATHFFFDKLNKGTYIIEYDVRVNNKGDFNDGIATIQSMYAPEFSVHSISNKIQIN